jgi:hypothetical protein
LIAGIQRDTGILGYFLKSALRGSWWLVVVPCLITTAVTAAQLLWRTELSPTLQVSTGEIMGSLLAGFLGANLLDAEFRLRAGELAFTKPYPPWKMLGGRVTAAMGAVLCLVAANAGFLSIGRHLHETGIALAATIAPSLFLCGVGCAIFTASANPILAYIGPTLFWIWSTLGAPLGLRFDRLYNPLVQISAWSDYLNERSAASLETLVANNLVLVATAAVLFWWCCWRARTSVLQ